MTNQATDDHIQDTHISEVKPWISVKTKCEISSKPHYIQGGHLLFEVTAERENKKYKMNAAAYEPTKGFRKIVEKLIKGDKVELWGGIRKDPLTLNIEKVKILKLEDRVVKVGNPLCPECGTSMSSIGKNAGYRCKKCSTKADESEVREKKVERELTKGWYETPVSARRHLSKPLSRDNTSRSISRRSA